MKRRLFTACIIITSISAAAFTNKQPVFDVNACKHAEKAVTGNYIEVVSVSPNPSKNGSVTVVSNISDTLRFYIFDAEGTMIHQDELTNKQTKTIDKLKKGTYTFDAFLKNEGVQHSNLVIE
jgi:hypothetical protein